MNFRIKNTKRTTKIIALYQIIGGVMGIFLISYLLLRTEMINGPVLFIFLFAMFLYGFSIHSGNLLLQSTNRKKGLIYSAILQGLQIFSFAIGNYSYEFYSGLKATIGFGFGDVFGFDFGLAISSFNIVINSGVDNYFLGINFIAIIILLILLDIYNEPKQVHAESTTSDILDAQLVEVNDS